MHGEQQWAKSVQIYSRLHTIKVDQIHLNSEN